MLEEGPAIWPSHEAEQHTGEQDAACRDIYFLLISIQHVPEFLRGSSPLTRISDR